jgi:hypothetical protein
MFKIYLSNLGAYTRGQLKGEWLTLPMTEEKLQAAVKKVLGNKGDEEFFITDYDLPFSISEYENLEELNNTIQELQELSLDPEELTALFKSSTCGDWKETAKKILDGDYTILEVTDKISLIDGSDIARTLYDEEYISFLGKIPDDIIEYIDWDHVWRECNISYGWNEIFFEESGRQFAVNI